MRKSQLYLLVGAVALVVLLFQLPRNVVENDQLQQVVDTKEHTFDIPEKVQAQIEALRSSIKSEENFAKKSIFAHSLAIAFLDYGVIDSALTYARAIEDWEIVASRKAADIYFIAFERSPSAEVGITYARQAREILEQLLEKDPEDLFLKNRLAMTLVASENPMVGISMLREIVEEDERNRQAILNLGLLSIQSGQFDRAKNRFEKLISLDSTDLESKLYLSVSMIELNEQTQARLLLEEILASGDSIPAIKAMADEYLKAL